MGTKQITLKCVNCNFVIVSAYNSFLIFNNNIYEISKGKYKKLSILRINQTNKHTLLTLLDKPQYIIFKKSKSLFDYINDLEKISIFS